MTYAAAPPVQYVTADGQPVQMEQQVQYVTADGQPVQMEQQVQYVTADGQPFQMEQQVQYVTADGQPVSYEYGAPAMQYAQQPAVFNVSPETFAKLAQGGALDEHEMHHIMGATALAPMVQERVAEATPLAVVPEASKAATPAPASKKGLSAKEKTSKGCC